MEVLGIKIAHVSLGKGELVRIERDENSARVYVKFDDGKESPFGLGTNFFNFFSIDSADDKKKIEEYISQMESEKKEAEEKRVAERMAEKKRIEDARANPALVFGKTSKASSKKTGKASGGSGYKLSRGDAEKILASGGYCLPSEFTLAANNKSVDIYWANPRIELVKKKWTLVLNNKYDRKLMVFVMDPSDAVMGSTVRAEMSKLVPRVDKDGVIDVRIFVDDLDFEEMFSGVKFAPYKVFEMNY